MMGSFESQNLQRASMLEQVAVQLKQLRGIVVLASLEKSPNSTAIDDLKLLSNQLRASGTAKEAEAIDQVISIAQASPNYGGLGVSSGRDISNEQTSELIFLASAWLESLNSSDRARLERVPATLKVPGTRPMTLTEKIFAMHDVEPRGFVSPGDTVRVSVDWILASEASWSSMEATYDSLGQPGIFRNDRFWLAGDHVADPRVNMHPTVQRLIQSSERAKKVFKMTEYQGMNYTIMHTEFYRERAQPGMIAIGSDSHTCSSGALGCLAIGLGVADVTMALITGETWFKVPECVNIRLIGKPGTGVGGKDVILYILQQLKRNTVAADRVVEYTGPGLAYLSPDARFAIANMTTEFGGITGIFVPDSVTSSFLASRKTARHKSSAHYFRPDEEAVYAERHIIDLSHTESFVAKFPNPDDVVPVSEMTGTQLDGCFIGACTTAEEDIILGALVLEQGLKNGLVPVSRGKRKVVPGSLPILDRLRTSGLASVYEDAGFEIGIPGCSYCVGMSADKAGENEVWLSSQNRNFENRMGKGSIGNLSSAATVAASSFSMTIQDPQPLIDQINLDRWESVKGRGSLKPVTRADPEYVEPSSSRMLPPVAGDITQDESHSTPSPSEIQSPLSLQKQDTFDEGNTSQAVTMIAGRAQKLGDFIDTDALAPAQYLMSCRTNEAIGAHCLEYTHPNFRSRAADGFNIVVAGKAFGCGSSREQAVSALIGCGVKCVIARSFAFIYSRNQPNLGLLGISMSDDDFFDAVSDGDPIQVDLARNIVLVGEQEFAFQLSSMEKDLMKLGGITPAFLKFGKQIFDSLCSGGVGYRQRRHRIPELQSSCGAPPELLQW